ELAVGADPGRWSDSSAGGSAAAEPPAGRIVGLPSYPFARVRCWADTVPPWPVPSAASDRARREWRPAARAPIPAPASRQVDTETAVLVGSSAGWPGAEVLIAPDAGPATVLLLADLDPDHAGSSWQ